MTNTKLPQFQLEKVYADGSKEEPELHCLAGINSSCRMGRRGFLLTSALGAGAAAALSGCLPFMSGAGPDNAEPLKFKGSVSEAKDIGEVNAHKDAVTHLAFSRDGTRLASVGGDNSIKVWELPGGKLLRSFDNTAPVSFIAFKASGELALSFQSGLFIYWSKDLTKRTEFLPANSSSIGSLLSPDGKKLATISMDKGIIIKSLTSGTSYKQVADIKGQFQTAAFSHDSSKLIAQSFAGAVSLHDADSGECLLKAGSGKTFAFSPDNNVLVVRLTSGLYLWDASSGQAGKTIKLYPALEKYLPCIFTPNGDWLVVGSKEGKSSRAKDGVMLLKKPYATASLFLHGQKGSVSRLACSPDSRLLATGSETGSIYIWQMPQGQDDVVFLTALFDPQVTNKLVSIRQATVDGKSVYIGRCGDPLPQGAVCTCNCVSGKFVPPGNTPVKGTICTCDKVPVRSRGGSYCSCNTICTCVPIK